MRDHPTLARLPVRGMRLGLERVEAVLAHLGNPERRYAVVHVAGTNGKGSVCTVVTAALVAAGHRVGTNLSPHLQTINERFRLQGEPVDDPVLDGWLLHVDEAARAWASAAGIEGEPLTYFELCTVAAFWGFAQAQVDVAVIEVGLGGRLDATNVVRPAVTAITSIGFDHVAQLGDTLPLIAVEKAGILKPGVVGVVGPMEADALAAIEAVAERVGAPLHRVGAEVVWEGASVRTPGAVSLPLTPAMAGPHQRANMAVAVGVLHALRNTGLAVADGAVAAGVAGGVIAGRMEWLAPDLLVDGAHNLAGTTALAAALVALGLTGVTLVYGVGLERDPVALGAPLWAHVGRVITTTCDHPSARGSADVAACLAAAGIAAEDGGRIDEALGMARGGGVVVVAGSLYLVGAARDAVGLAHNAERHQ